MCLNVGEHLLCLMQLCRETFVAVNDLRDHVESIGRALSVTCLELRHGGGHVGH